MQMRANLPRETAPNLSETDEGASAPPLLVGHQPRSQPSISCCGVTTASKKRPLNSRRCAREPGRGSRLLHARHLKKIATCTHVRVFRRLPQAQHWCKTNIRAFELIAPLSTAARAKDRGHGVAQSMPAGAVVLCIPQGGGRSIMRHISAKNLGSMGPHDTPKGPCRARLRFCFTCQS